jgi:acyl-CoA dehydrogenase
LAWAFHDAVYKIQTALGNVVDNFPSRAVRILLAVIIFPLGRHEREPGDRLGHKVAQLLLSPSETRSRLTKGAFISSSEDNPVGLLEIALPKVIAMEPLERRLLKAQNSGELDVMAKKTQLDQAVELSIITAEEARELKIVRKLVAEIISVDEFESSVLRMGQRNTVEHGTEQAA